MNSTPFKKRESPISINSNDQVETTREKPQFKKKVSEPVKEKYTAVMDKDLRIRVKVASAKKNLQFSQFVEEAVLEKLEREGF